MQLTLSRTPDFQVDGQGGDCLWQRTPWIELPRVGGEAPYRTRVKAMYSESGLYFLYECEDQRLVCPVTEDFGMLFSGDVLEIFLWPDPRHPLYLEYELSPLGHELPLLVPNHNGTFCGWLPFAYEGARRVRKATHIRGGDKRSDATVTGWTAELFIPFALFTGLGNALPQPGALWRGNLCRIDYDAGRPSHWSLSAATGTNFHDFASYALLRFAQDGDEHAIDTAH